MIHAFSVYLKATFTHRELCDVTYLFLDIMCCSIHMLILLHVSTTSKDVDKFLQIHLKMLTNIFHLAFLLLRVP